MRPPFSPPVMSSFYGSMKSTGFGDVTSHLPHGILGSPRKAELCFFMQHNNTCPRSLALWDLPPQGICENQMELGIFQTSKGAALVACLLQARGTRAAAALGPATWSQVEEEGCFWSLSGLCLLSHLGPSSPSWTMPAILRQFIWNKYYIDYIFFIDI